MVSVDHFLQLFTALVFAVAIFLFVRIYRDSKKAHPAEDGLTPLFEEQAGARFDYLNLTIPFVRHAIYDDFVVISTRKRYYKLNFNQIARFEVKRHVFSIGITYYHNISGIPKKLIVWTTNPGWVSSLLESKGVST